MTKPLRDLSVHEVHELTKRSVHDRCARIIAEFDEWLAVHVVRLGIKHDDIPQLNDAFRDYFANTRTARHPDNRRVEAAPRVTQGRLKECEHCGKIDGCVCNVVAHAPLRVDCVQCGWALIEGSAPGSRCAGCARLIGYQR